MGIYSQGNIEDFMLESATTTEYDDRYEPTLEGAYLIVAESEQNFARLMEGAGIDELKYLEEHQAEMPYNEGAGSEFFAKAKAFFIGIGNKIKALFKRFFAMFDSVIKSDKEFISKYEKDLVKISGTDKMEYKGFHFTIKPPKTAVNIKAETLTGNLPTSSDQDMGEWQETMRGHVCGGGSLSASEFSKELFAAYRNGETSKESLTGVKATDIITQLKGSAANKKEAENAMKAILTAVNKAIKDTELEQKNSVNDSVKTGADNSNAISLATTKITAYKDGLAILQIANGALLSAIKAESSQSKSLAQKMLTFRAAKEGAELGGYANESASAVSAINFL